MDIKTTNTEDFVIYIGSNERYGGDKFDKDRLIKEIRNYKENVGEIMCLSIGEIYYVAGDFYEDGWAIRLINYGRFPKSYLKRLNFMEGLSKYLLVNLNQNRISLVTPSFTRLYENEQPQESHKPERV